MSDPARSGPAHFADPAAALAALASLVLKERVLLGGLPAPHRAAVLGLAWCALPAGVALREPEVNAALKRCLAEACSFVAVDHVELRRWLVDTGWLVRDGFGREYRRVAATGFAPECAHIATAVSTIDPPRWAADIRDADAAQRYVRRQAWEAREGREAHRAAETVEPARQEQGGANDKGPA